MIRALEIKWLTTLAARTKTFRAKMLDRRANFAECTGDTVADYRSIQ